jgi:hypothetical protein
MARRPLDDCRIHDAIAVVIRGNRIETGAAQHNLADRSRLRQLHPPPPRGARVCRGVRHAVAVVIAGDERHRGPTEHTVETARESRTRRPDRPRRAVIDGHIRGPVAVEVEAADRCAALGLHCHRRVVASVRTKDAPHAGRGLEHGDVGLTVAVVVAGHGHITRTAPIDPEDRCAMET